ncbi:lytic transglycosylase domain-containing protein [Rhodospirillum rubrum]|uniref:Lytic transglycosylase, catalytic n=1 Tax=Rhodospirillum rubrum (strain ATCC 11170 / ATH 1.1.1 / DSM 467 / LMG 4362 / NCIMB 8255 / S1) TaxID=269796 RepID=Q2RT79_RHORT|nr:lytic transglycosylase domain-containing protein [Rhodospirillum rubrum]ABC22666.1 Lytic transglycosylase, catalytic [Rhodospirillum rubrum ATCC 11170]AEO48384.1 lytic transglycosylase, catalytic [Rhodospirillum rubrum F11]MBK5954263.1 lytic transglycosylase [Rhodospirillum rubrum]QXG82287.1 lytic transglycosylase domain-containing protein [Rhodospirillum rubrum]HAP98461.1 lytic transglycosylase domain-containing protein [Rhodospirillum rubrum]
MRLLSIVLVCLIILPLAARAAPLSVSDEATYAGAFRAADLGQWPQAMALARSASDQTLRDVVLWRQLRAAGRDNAGLEDRMAFVLGHPDWPLLSTIQRLAEDDMLSLPRAPSQVIGFLERRKPVSPGGEIALARAYLASGARDKAARLIRSAWVAGDFTASQEKDLLGTYGDLLRTDDHWARADRVMWDNRIDAARRMVPRLDKARAAVITARVTLAEGKIDPNAAVNAVPKALQNDPGLVFERARWRRLAGLDDAAIELMLHRPSAEGRADRWWQERAVLLREALDRGLITKAYRLAATHENDRGAAFAEGEWLAGWIALRFLHDAPQAFKHFKTLYEGVSTPISLSRGAYWAGRAAEAMKRPDEARQWYQKASAFPATFYGQLAAERTGAPLSKLLPKADAAASDAERKALANDRLVVIASQLAQIGRIDELLSFTLALNTKHKGDGARAMIAGIALKAGYPGVGVFVSRRAAQDGTYLVEAGYPLPKALAPSISEHARRQGVDPAALLGLIRQESNFDRAARSAVGALGLMQLMPGTARTVSGQEGLAFDQALLTRDPLYNVRLGARYFGDLLKRFDGSVVLAAAAYNAGPGRPTEWIARNGDPRAMDLADAIDWIEMIPYRETRNYVQRVIEGMLVYQVRLGQTLPAKAPAQALGIAGRS